MQNHHNVLVSESDRKWQLVVDGQTGGGPYTQLTKDTAKIRISYCCLWCWLGRSKLRVQIIPFVPVDLRSVKQAALTVYASKSYEVEVIILVFLISLKLTEQVHQNQ